MITTLALGEPIRSIAPRASTGSAGSLMSKRRYLKLVLPRLATRTFNAADPPPNARTTAVVRPGNDVGGLELADPAGGLGAGLDGGSHAADVAPDHHAHDAAVELDHRAGQLDAGRLEHRINRTDQPDQAECLDQAQGVSVHCLCSRCRWWHGHLARGLHDAARCPCHGGS